MTKQVWLSIVCCLISTASCKRLSTGARESFAKKWSCPESRVEVRERKDVKWGDVINPGASSESPPEEVGRDPERLAKWRKDRESGAAETRRRLDDLDVFEARGCGHSELMACWRPGSGDVGSVEPNEVNCHHRAHPPNMKPW